MGRRTYWTDDKVKDALAPWVNRLGKVPSTRQLEAAGQSGLAKAMVKRKSAAEWAQVFGLEPLRDERGRWWTEARIQAELDEFIPGWTYWPTREDFVVAGRLALWQGIRRQHGLAFWADRYGFPPPTIGKRRKP